MAVAELVKQTSVQQAVDTLRKGGVKSNYENFIGGRWLAPVKGKYFTDCSPINGEPICEIARSSAEDVEKALDVAHAVKGVWGRTAPALRASILLKIADKRRIAMRTARVILVGVFLAAACSTAFGNVMFSCPSNVAVTSSLVASCRGNIFDFGHDLPGNPANPLPLGGSVTLKFVTYFIRVDGFPEWDLDFSFPHPAKGTTELNFSIFAPPCNCLNGVFFIGLGMSLSPFGTLNPNPVTESGSSFLITETATSILGDQATLSISGGNAWERGPLGPPRREPFLYPSVRVTTMITDNAGDLTGFNEGFATPEPQSWMLLGSGLFGIYALRLRGATGRINSYKRVRESSSL